MYPTTNVYNSLKLYTAIGRVTALQISLGETYGMEYDISDAVVPNETVIGGFELYPTQNNYNFILLDTIVQWNTDKNKCGKIRLW